MKPLSNRKKIILATVIVLVLGLIEVLRETEVIEISYYRSHIRAKTNKSWSGIGLTEPLDFNKRAVNKCGQPVIIKNISVEASYENCKYIITTDTCDKEFVELSTFNTGLIWTPLIKKTSFHATANVVVTVTTDRIEKNSYKKIDTQKGSISIDGQASILGLCSAKEARKIILTHALKELAHAVKDRLHELD